MDHQTTLSHQEQSARNEALRRTRRAAQDGNTPGFMLAFTDGRIGFSFLVCKYDFQAALHAVPSDGTTDAPKYSCAFREGRDPDDSFVAEYLQTAAANIGIEYVRLFTHLAFRNSTWRFEPWEYLKPGRSQDNDSIWRNRLWPWVKRITASPPACLETMPYDPLMALLRQMRRHATEGMIVLER